jgi:hypothetical protein
MICPESIFHRNLCYWILAIWNVRAIMGQICIALQCYECLVTDLIKHKFLEYSSFISRLGRACSQLLFTAPSPQSDVCQKLLNTGFVFSGRHKDSLCIVFFKCYLLLIL